MDYTQAMNGLEKNATIEEKVNKDGEMGWREVIVIAAHCPPL